MQGLKSVEPPVEALPQTEFEGPGGSVAPNLPEEGSGSTHAHTRARTHAHRHVHAHKHMNTHTHTGTCAHAHTHARTRTEGNSVMSSEVNVEGVDAFQHRSLGGGMGDGKRGPY